MENNVYPISEYDANPRMVCEITFESFVKMEAPAFKVIQKEGIFTREKQIKKPQWFRIQGQFTYDAIREGDPYQLGMQLKNMLRDLDMSIKKYENG